MPKLKQAPAKPLTEYEKQKIYLAKLGLTHDDVPREWAKLMEKMQSAVAATIEADKYRESELNKASEPATKKKAG
ncbi:hypothetical protein [Sporomusa malonica]|uniref:Uncharacterized protein n=1 Tax=Sporomusa malonica TaxID=112901 RepID=A0A1W2AUL9_9FIRM|nr:hypothetical protein [Sporomusa malonica]SMC64220.1 hypothetical protein SAMN04488500_106122 [Sporomusa malonica]